jgi:CRISPR/Cas system endoribonuclease Cas6 (RAMP superfamily)
LVIAEVRAEGPAGPMCVYTAAGGLREDEGGCLTAADLAADPRAVPAGPRLTVEFLTPTRIRNDGAVRAEPSFQDLARALLRRLSSLCYFHCGGELDVDFRGLIDRAAAVRTVDAALRWQAQGRFSGRQRRDIYMSGFVGRITFEAPAADDWAPFLPLLLAGEWAHVGKGTVMGLGRYRVET